MSLKDRIAKNFQQPNLKEAKKRTRNNTDVLYKNETQIDGELIGIGKNKTYHIKTYGCQMNEHDTEVMAGILNVMGYEETDDMFKADVVILNTCAIRENAENKVFGKIGSLKKTKLENPEKIIAVCGCMGQEEKVVNTLLKKYQFIDIIFGTHNIHRLPNLILQSIREKAMVVEVWSGEGKIIEDLPKTRASNKKAWVNIIYGCDKFCTYCIVPFTRGKERSRMPKDILEEIKELKEKGYKEVTLLGQNVNAYGKDLNIGYTMGNLLEDVAKIGIERIRFTTSHPWDFDDQMIEIIGKYDNIMPNLHLPVQSGDDAVLKIMGRSYNIKKYLDIFDKVKKAKPGITITTDIIVGYPNETEEQFQKTLDIYNRCKFDLAYTFIFSPREGTPADKMVDNVSLEDKKQRLYRLNDLVDKYSSESNHKMIGKTLKVLVDGPSNKDDTILAGYSEENKLVHFKGDESLIGEIVKVKITYAKKFNVFGDLVN